MKTMIRWGTGACVAALALALNLGVASAQQPAAPATPAPAAKAPAVKAPAAKKAEAPKKAAPKPASACKGLPEAACTANAECSWHKEGTVSKGARKGAKIAAHCQKSTPPPAAKKAAAPAKATPAPAKAAPAPAPAKKN